MRSPSALAAATLACALVAAGCADGYEAESIRGELELELDDPALEFRVQPERADHTPPPAQPIVPLPVPDASEGEEGWGPRTYAAPEAGAPRLEFDADGRAGPCKFGVRAHGLPAIDREAERVVNLEYENAQGPSDYDTSRATLVWRDFDDGVVRSVELYDGETLGETLDYAPWETCGRLRRQLNAQLPTLNEALASQPLEPMPALPVQLAYPNAGEPSLPARGHERPVELVYRSGDLVARVRGLEILARAPHPSWQGPRDTLDAYDPSVVGATATARPGSPWSCAATRRPAA
ncbi:hypothetical protein PPSIR1_06361 [Plesiocystis pacifica SIR-1]|uniref:Lipoprotein n=1 Tax=Plesiocystis pacifica SIR-1 TaxID=391625 RepID=A6G6Z7_9BACT|nr:hypothetical protein [Plesiocystis pacifica]EDM78450.1 hypothetical protein PPSIR1_06361 [Plesiocystis pacifica SIR-1]